MKILIILLIITQFQIASLTETKRRELNLKLQQRIQKYRNLEIVDGKFQKMEPKNESEKDFFEKVDNLTEQKETSFASNEDDFIGNDLVEDLDPNKTTKESYPEKVNPFKEPEPFRGPSQLKIQTPQIENLHTENLLTKDSLVANITSFHATILQCLEDHSRSKHYNQISFEEIKQDCFGPKMSRLKEFYNDISFQIKQYFLAEITLILMRGICQENFILCLEYYRALELTAELNLLMEETILANAAFMAAQIGEAKVNFLFKITSENMRSYNFLFQLLQKEKHKLALLLQSKWEDHRDFSGYVPPVIEQMNQDIPEPVGAVAFQRGMLPMSFKQIKSEENASVVDNYSWTTKVKEEPEVLTSEFLGTEKVTPFKGKSSVNFPETSEELDKLHENAHKLMKFRLNELAKLPVGHIFKKE